MVRPSILGLSKNEPLFQPKFFSNASFSMKRDQKLFVDGSLETAWKYLSLRTNRLKKNWEVQKWCAPHFWVFRKTSHFFSASSVQMKVSLWKGIRNCSLMALGMPLESTFLLKQTAWKFIENSRNGTPLNFCFFEKRANFSAQVLFNKKFLYRRGSENVHWGLSGKYLGIPFI